MLTFDIFLKKPTYYLLTSLVHINTISCVIRDFQGFCSGKCL